MDNSQKSNSNVTVAQMKYMLKHKLASLLTQQKIKDIKVNDQTDLKKLLPADETPQQETLFD